MTRQIQSTDLSNAVQLLADNGFEGMADAIQILFNEAMKIERTQYIGAEPYQRTDQRRSYANGFKSKTINSRLGKCSRRQRRTRPLRRTSQGHRAEARQLG